MTLTQIKQSITNLEARKLTVEQLINTYAHRNNGYWNSCWIGELDGYKFQISRLKRQLKQAK